MAYCIWMLYFVGAVDVEKLSKGQGVSIAVSVVTFFHSICQFAANFNRKHAHQISIFAVILHEVQKTRAFFLLMSNVIILILSTVTRIRIDYVMRSRSSSRGRNASASVTVTVTGMFIQNICRNVRLNLPIQIQKTRAFLLLKSNLIIWLLSCFCYNSIIYVAQKRRRCSASNGSRSGKTGYHFVYC